MNLRSQMMEKLAALRLAADTLSAAISALDGVNPPDLQSPTSGASQAPITALFPEVPDDKS
jgi:hypothetical protein